MDAFGLALALSSSFGMHILDAGNAISAPSGAALAIVSVRPEALILQYGGVSLSEQVYIVTKDNSCTLSILSTTGTNYFTWEWGNQNGDVNVIYLG